MPGSATPPMQGQEVTPFCAKAIATNCLVTLVHGTFARGASWTRSDSALANSLREEFGTAHVVIEPFRWSGSNSPRARRRAALELRASLEDNARQHPEALQFIVGHSHGGNVAIEAVLGSERLTSSVGVATLATPFVHTRERATSPSGDPQILQWILLFLWAVAVSALFFVTAVATRWPQSFAQREGLVLSLWVLLNVPMALLFAKHLSRGVQRLGVAVRQCMDVTVPESFNLLVVRYVGDEASAILTVSQFQAWLIARAWRILGIVLFPITKLTSFNRIVGPLLRAFLIIAGTTALAYGDAIASISGFGRRFNLPDISRLVQLLWLEIRNPGGPFLAPATVVALLATSYIYIAVLASIVTLLLTFALLPFGPEAVLVALGAEVSVEPVPAGAWTVHQFVAADLSDARLTGLVHSAAYNDRRVSRLLAAWMEESQKRAHSESLASPTATARGW